MSAVGHMSTATMLLFGRRMPNERQVSMQVQSGKPRGRRALKSEDSMSVSATDSEADSLLADSGAAKRKPGAKKGAGHLAAPCKGSHASLALMRLFSAGAAAREFWRTDAGRGKYAHVCEMLPYLSSYSV